MENRHTIVFLIITLFLLPSCHPRVITQLQVHRDTTYVTAYLRDSVVHRDSIWIKERVAGDTIRITEYRDRWRERVRVQHDTIIRRQIDTIAVQRTIERKVEQPLGWGKKVRLRAFWAILILALVGWRREIYKLFKRYI
jgi:hypothetical protein